jgi:hypothetical protein
MLVVVGLFAGMRDLLTGVVYFFFGGGSNPRTA